MSQRFPRRARPLAAAAVILFASFGMAAAAHVKRAGPDLLARLYVIQVCRQEEGPERKAALEGLRKLGWRAAPALAARARDTKDGEMAEDLWPILAECAGEREVALLGANLRGGPESRRMAIIQALARIGTKEAGKALGQGLTDPKGEIRAEARKGLKGHEPEVLEGAVWEALGSPTMIPEVIRGLLVDEGLVYAAVRPVSAALRSQEMTRIMNALYLARHVYLEYPPGAVYEEELMSAVAGAVDRLDPSGQLVAIEVLGALDYSGRTAALCAVAGGNGYAEPVRIAAVRALGSRRDPKAVATLEGMLRKGRFQIQMAAAETLGKVGTAEDAERWLALVEEGRLDWQPRELLFRAIASAGESSLTGRLLALASKIETPGLLEAIRGTARRDPLVSVPALLATLADVSPQGLTWLNETLQDLTWHRSSFRHVPRTMEEFVAIRADLAAEWKGWWSRNRDKGLEEWKREGLADIDRELTSASVETRYDALLRLLRIAPQDIEARLLPRIDDDEDLIWARSMDVLLDSRSPMALDFYRMRVQRGGAPGAARAARMLGLVDDKGAVDSLMEGAKRPESALRRECAFALGRIGDARASRLLVSLLQDVSPDVRVEARAALEAIGDRSIEPEMIAGAASEDVEYATACATVLGRIGGPKAVRALAALFLHEDEMLKRAAVRSMTTLTGRAPGLNPTEADLRGWERLLERR